MPKFANINPLQIIFNSMGYKKKKKKKKNILTY